jgi:hypothetical protein
MSQVLMKILHQNQLPVDCHYWVAIQVVTVNDLWIKGWTIRFCQVQDTVENGFIDFIIVSVIRGEVTRMEVFQ